MQCFVITHAVLCEAFDVGFIDFLARGTILFCTVLLFFQLTCKLDWFRQQASLGSCGLPALQTAFQLSCTQDMSLLSQIYQKLSIPELKNNFLQNTSLGKRLLGY